MAPAVHALMLTFPAAGHINPLLQLASRLVSHGWRITVVDTQRSHPDALLAAQRGARASTDLIGTVLFPQQASVDLASKSPNRLNVEMGPGIRFFTVSDGLPNSFKLDMSAIALVQLLDALERQRGVLEQLVETSKSSDSPISCIIADNFFSWAMDLAASFGLPGVFCMTSNATCVAFSSLQLQRSGKWTREGAERDEFADLGNSRISKENILALASIPEDSPIEKVAKSITDGLFKASQILVNSFQELEDHINLAESLKSKLWFVGPLLSVELHEAKANGDVHVQTSGVGQNSEYIRWLDMQGKNSVLYISLGSVAALPPADVSEIAEGIEESGLKFLWVARPDCEGKTHLPQGFQERMKDRGRVIPWAEQMVVLNHPATGGFLTHGGWNSVMESIFMGVPMLCIPIFAEQPINCELVVKQWELGIPLRNSEGALTREHVKKAARALMNGIESKAMRERVNVWKEAATNALSNGGSSSVALSEFIDCVSKHSCGQK